ncbi:MAG: type II toxin-antitoxin system death-on-curing family toxin [Gemmatimonadales bacterium]|nr:type II toxin-antitoxin system death-on-curing family toxin [Gemmatimonadales bacterium]MDZ4389586.1 type II toxin-antitoxin system death-on-curing family toxin [Gemmatimonadales bacterium]
MEPRWLNATMIRAIHTSQTQEHGGSLGLRDQGLLDSALDRPRNRFHHEPEADLFDLAAAYGFGLARNHPFVDGNKRIAFQAMYLFLGLNGLRIDAGEPEVVRLVLALAAGDLPEPKLAAWLKQHTSSR